MQLRVELESMQPVHLMHAMRLPDANPSSAAEMDPRVTAMWSQARKVRSFAKKVLGSMRMGVVVVICRLGAMPRSFISALGSWRRDRAAEWG